MSNQQAIDENNYITKSSTSLDSFHLKAKAPYMTTRTAEYSFQLNPAVPNNA